MTSTLFVEEVKGRTSGTNANKVIVPSGQTLKVDGSVLVDNSRLAFDAAGHLQVKSGGLTINTVGQALGVGTNNPGHTIEAKGTAPEIMLEETSSGGSKRVSMGVTSGGQPFINAEQSGGSIAMNMTGTEVAKFQSTGLAFPAGKGIDFTASADGAGTSINEVLTDYEHGTWTPTAQGGQTIGTVYSAFYQKIGQMVYVGTYFTTSATPNNSGMWYFGGLPFAVASGSHYHAAGSITYIHTFNNSSLGMLPPTPYSGGGTTFYFHRDSGTAATVLNSDVQGFSHLIVGFWYYTTA